MKNFYDLLLKPLFVAAFVMTFSYAHAQDENLFVKEGKTWECYWFVDGKDYVYTITGDTIINGTAYKKMYLDGKYQYAVRQDGQKVYWMRETEEEEMLVYDFGLNAGDVFVYDNLVKLRVLKVDTVNVNGIDFRRLHVQTVFDDSNNENENPDESSYYWVEGVGIHEEPIQPYFSFLIETPYAMRRCLDNGECIFSYDDFFIGTGIATPTQEKAESKDAPVYDLAGRRVDGKALHRGIYIRNGKKFVVK